MKHFTIEELIYSETALHKRMRNKTNQQIETNLRMLVETVLDPLREAYGKPITVTSGYRCKELNRAVGGVSNSQHVSGCAADITVNSRSGNRDLMRLAVKLGLPIDQAIDEKDFQWVHISCAGGLTPPRHQLLRYDGRTYRNITIQEI